MDLNKVIKAVRPNEIIEARFKLEPKENDIIDMILSKIENDNTYKYNINVSEYVRLYKKGKTNAYRDLKSATESIYEKDLRIKVADKLIRMRWFSSIGYDEEKGCMSIELGDTLKQLLLKVKEDKSKRIYYDITYPLNFRSIYSKRMYYMIKSFQSTGYRIDKLEDLKAKLECSSPTYEQYRYFKSKILNKAQQEINDTSDLYFEFKEIKEKGKVVRIEFDIKKNPDSEFMQEVVLTDTENSEIDILVQQIQDIMPHVPYKAAQLLLNAYGNNIEKISKAYAYVVHMGKTRVIKNVIAYMLKIKDAELDNVELGTFSKIETGSNIDKQINEFANYRLP